jgi:hypothetical protein
MFGRGISQHVSNRNEPKVMLIWLGGSMNRDIVSGGRSTSRMAVCIGPLLPLHHLSVLVVVSDDFGFFLFLLPS